MEVKEYKYEYLISEIKSLNEELARLKHDNYERIKCECISNAAMKKALMQDHPSAEIEHFLSSIGRSLDVDRIYIFEDDPDGEGTNNTYEWCNKGVYPQLENLQKIPFIAVQWWYDQFGKGKGIHIVDLEAIRDAEPLTYAYLKPQGIHSLIAKGLIKDNRIIGFFGVDNPRIELMSDISSFLDTLSNFLGSLIQNRDIYLSSEAKYVAALKEKNLELNEALQRAEEASMAKSQFLSSMSHDIRTPLNAIIGMTTIAKDHIEERGRVEDCLEKIMLSSKHLLGLINDVLDMAKIESGKMTLCLEDLSLSEVLDAVSTITRIQAKEKDLDYNIHIHELISDWVYCDNLRLNQILLNLLSNAIKFTPEGGRVNVELWQEPSQKGGGFLTNHICVEDTGIGMSPEFLKTIFESFTREDAKRVQKTQGTGLGMAITKRIVDMMGGVIEVSSEPGQGSRFHVILDFKAGDTQTESRKVRETVKGSLKGMQILLAEDNEVNAEIATVILEENGAVVTHCEDGVKTVKAFEEAPAGNYNVILMDLRMPNMGGIEATRYIRSLDRPDAKTIPIIAMTADAFSDDVQNCLEAGMNAHVAKPIDVDLLKKTILKLVAS